MQGRLIIREYMDICGQFAGSLRAGKRAAAVMSLIRSAKLHGHDPYVYLKGVLTRLPTQQASQIGQLLPHRWQAILLAQT